MATFNKFQDFAEQIGKAIHDFSTHTIKVMLTNTAPTSTNAVKADLTEISAGNGYTAGGTASSATWSETGGTGKLVLTDVVFTASGGSIGPFRYAVIYNDTSASDNLIGYYDYGSSISLASGESLTVDFDATNGVLQIT
jgi:hypothetical protein